MADDTPTPPAAANNTPPAAEDAPPPVKFTLMTRLRNYFLAGILITAPISITLYIAWVFIAFVDRTVTPLLPARYNPETYLPFGLPGLGLVIVVVALTAIGALTAGFLGRLVMRFYDRILAKMPVLRGIYSATKQLFETLLAEKTQSFREAVLVEYPRRGMWTVAFVTGQTAGEPRHRLQPHLGEEMVNIYVPTTPNPTSGFLLVVPRRDLVDLDMPVEDALKMVISVGIVTPPFKPAPSLPRS
jgi:uncharacterized membrane protein